MKVTSLLAGFLLMTLFSFAQNTVPQVNVKTLGGQSQSLSEFIKNDKITVLSFWATWCTPCKKELSAIAENYDSWKEDLGVEVLAITIDDTRQLSKVPGIVETSGWEYTILCGNQNEMQNAFNFQTIPQTFVVDKDGKIVYTHSGYVPGDEYELEEQLKKIAGK